MMQLFFFFFFLLFFFGTLTYGLEPGLEFSEPEVGDILTQEDLGITHGVQIDRLQYLTNIQNELRPARTLVFRFAGAQPTRSFMVFYAHQTVGVNCECSFANNGSNLDKIQSVPSLVDFLKRGFTVIVPDYYGFVCPNQVHPYLIGIPVATSILDALRAATKWKPGFFSHVVAEYGWSQGGHSVLWTQYYAPSYAPEFHLLSAAAIAPPTNLPDLMETNLKSLPGKFLSILGIYSWPVYYPNFLASTQLVKINKVETVDQLAQVCLLTPKPERNPQLMELLFLRNQWLKQDPRKDSRWSQLLRENSPPPHVSPGTQLSIWQGKKDKLIDWNVTQAWVESVPQPLAFFLYEKQDHRSILKVALPLIIEQFTSAFLTTTFPSSN